MIRETEIDGVPTFFAHRPGPISAGLTFRVGRADETLATSGITHLVEHLALYRHGVADYHYNGATASLFTVFAVQGSAEHVVEYLTGVCDGLARLPLDRLEAEKSILRTEAASRSDPSVPLWRYGAQGRGLVSCRELGLDRLSGREVSDWAQKWFTRDNAVLWLAGDDIPKDLRLDLVAGRRMPVVLPPPVLERTPAYVARGQGGVLMNTLVPRGAVAQLYASIIERELFQTLRRDGGLSYMAEASYQPGAADTAEINALADALPDKQDAVVGEFIDVLAKLSAGRINPADVDALRTNGDQAFTHPDYELSTLPGRAFGHLIGRTARNVDQLRAELAAVSTEDVVAMARVAHANSLLVVPEGHRLDWAGYDEVSVTSRFETPAGYRYRSRSGDTCELVVGPEGISLTSPAGPATVAYKECAAMLAWPDGARLLVGRDGVQARVEPTLFEVDRAKLAEIDRNVDAAVVIPMPAREAKAIPQPAQPEAEPKLRKPLRNLAISAIVTAVLIIMTIQFASAWKPSDGELAEKAILWLLLGSAGSVLVTYFTGMSVLLAWRRRRSSPA